MPGAGRRHWNWDWNGQVHQQWKPTQTVLTIPHKVPALTFDTWPWHSSAAPSYRDGWMIRGMEKLQGFRAMCRTSPMTHCSYLTTHLVSKGNLKQQNDSPVEGRTQLQFIPKSLLLPCGRHSLQILCLNPHMNYLHFLSKILNVFQIDGSKGKPNSLWMGLNIVF